MPTTGAPLLRAKWQRVAALLCNTASDKGLLWEALAVCFSHKSRSQYVTRTHLRAMLVQRRQMGCCVLQLRLRRAFRCVWVEYVTLRKKSDLSAANWCGQLSCLQTARLTRDNWPARPK